MDIAIRAIQDDGDMTLIGNDLEVFRGYENMPYLGTFNAGPEGADWWGNSLVPGNSFKFSSETEKILDTTPLTSSGRIIIENAILRDLKFITDNTPGTELKVVVQIVSDDNLRITVSVNGEEFFINWNPDYQQPSVVAPPPTPPPLLPILHWPAENITTAPAPPVPYDVLMEWKEEQDNDFSFNQFDSPAPPIAVLPGSLNGYSVIRFNGADGENVRTASKIDLSYTPIATMVLVMNKGTGFLVGRLAGLTEPNFGYETLGDTFGSAITTSDIRADQRYSTPPSGKLTGANSGTGWKVYELSFDRANVAKVYIDGVYVNTYNLGSGTIPANFGIHYLVLGSNYANPGYLPIKCQIAEVMLYDTLLDIQQRADIVAAMQAKFNL